MLVALITACGGGIIAAITLVEGGISGTGISFGSILAFGSVVVNGTTLEVNPQTVIFIDEQPANQEELKVGYVIRVEADFDNGSAKRIDYVETVRGPITTVPAINPDTLAGSFDVLGQSIVTNSLTIFDGIDVATLTTSNVLDVSGVRDSSGAIIARYIQLLPPTVDEYRLVGEIANTTATEFTIGNLVVNYATANISNLNGSVEDGIEVRVKGLDTSFVPGSFVAESISDSVLDLGIQIEDSVELEGAVTDFSSISDMEVNGFPVNALNAVIEEGDISDIVLDALLEVEGTVDSSGILNASKVKLIPTNTIRIEASVDSVDDVNNSIVVLGKTFQLNQKTQLEDGSSAKISKFSLTDLSPGDWIEIRGYPKDNINVLTRLKRDDPDNDVLLQAPVDENGIGLNNTVSLLGITVPTDGNTSYEDLNNLAISEIQFFSTVSEGKLVKARWKNFTDTSIPVDELSLEE